MKGLAFVLALLSGPVALLLGQGTVEALQHGLLFAVATIVAGSMVLTNHGGRAWGIVLIVVALLGLVAAGISVFGVVLALLAGLLALMVQASGATKAT
jgi:hypothetical protein